MYISISPGVLVAVCDVAALASLGNIADNPGAPGNLDLVFRDLNIMLGVFWIPEND